MRSKQKSVFGNQPALSHPRFPYRSYKAYRSYYKFAVAAVFAALLLTGCKATETLAQGITTKNTSGNGTVIESHIGLNTETKIPELKTLFVSGDIATVKSGTNSVSYREESSASVWNASSVTKKRFLAITLSDDGDVPETIKAVAEVFKTAEAEAKPAAEVKPAAEAKPAAETK